MESSYWQWFCNLMISGSVLFFWFCFCISLSVHIFYFFFIVLFVPLKSQDGVYSFRHQNCFQCVPSCESLFLKHNESNRLKVRVCIRGGFVVRPWKEVGGLCPPSPKLSKGFQQYTFKGKLVGGGQLLQTSWYQNPLFLLLSVQVSHDIPVNLQ